MGDLGIFNLDIIGFRSDLKFLRLLKLRLMLLLMLIENIRPGTLAILIYKLARVSDPEQ